MRIGVLCNSKLSLPSLYFLSQQGVPLSIILPEEQQEDHYEIDQFATSQAIPIQRWNKKELNTNLYSWAAMSQLEAVWVITFPYIISKNTIQRTAVPILNFHFAPLPKYKGAQPVFWMIKNKEKQGGITVHQITEKIDSGPILHFEPYQMKEHETFGSYNVNIAQLNVNVIVAVFQKLNQPNWEKQLKKQQPLELVNCAKPQFEEVQILWASMHASEIEALCRACNPWNKGAICSLNGTMLKFLDLKPVKSEKHKGEPAGTIVLLEKTGRLAISTLDERYLDIEVAYLEEGYFGNKQLQAMGICSGLTLL